MKGLSNPAPPSMKSLANQEKENKNDNEKTSAVTTSRETGTKKSMSSSLPEKPHGFPPFLACSAPAVNRSFQNKTILNRSNLDIARDTKRILEICYANKDSSEVEASVGKETKSNKKKKGKKRNKKKKLSKMEVKGETQETKPLTNQNDANSDVDTQENMNKTTALKTAPKAGILPSQDAANPESKSIPGKKQKKKRVVIKRDKSGRIVRKRIKGRKGRGRVVNPNAFKKGRNANIGLATITEDFYQDLEGSDSDSDESSIVTFDSNDCDDIWCTDDPLSLPTSSDDDDSDFETEDDTEDTSTRGASAERSKNAENKNTKKPNSGNTNTEKDENPKNTLQRIIKKKYNSKKTTKKASSANEAPPTAGRQLYTDPPGVTSDFLNSTNNTNSTTTSGESVRNSSLSGTVITTDNNQDSESSSEESVDSTCCTSTASAQNENSRRGVSAWWCCRSKLTMACTGLLFMVTVAAGTVAIGYIFFFRDRFEDDEVEPTSPLAPTTAPSLETRPNLRPSQKPSPGIIVTPPPAPILTTLSTSCYMPNEVPGTITSQAEYSTAMNAFATISNSNSGYCGEGYVSIPANPGSGFGFPSLEVESNGYYTIALRYSNADNAQTSLALIINDQEEGIFDLLPTGNEFSWLVGTIDNVLLREGENSIRISIMNSDQMTEPRVDWLALVLQKPLTAFDYFSGLVAEASGISAQTLIQTRTLQWMSNEDPIDYSRLTDAEIIERYALLQIYYSTAGDMWRNKNMWLSEFHVCAWYGIICSEDMFVTDLMLGTSFRSQLTLNQIITDSKNSIIIFQLQMAHSHF